MKHLLLALSVAAASAAPLSAHHSFAAEYDGMQPVTVSGTVAKIEWTNPHCHLYLDVKETNGKTTNWKFEGYPPNVLARTGFKREVTLKVGDNLTIFAWQARNGTALAHAREITLANGQKLYFGPPAGTGEGTAIVP